MPLVAVIGQADRARYLSLGARETQTEVVGNPKFDSLVLIARQSPRFSERSLGRKILIAGSTEENEESLIIDSWLLQAEKPHLILAPRHLGRLPGLLANLKERQLAYRLLSARPELDWPNEPDLIVVDCLGALGQLYAQADLAIIGGSLFRGQGHNPLEPAAYGRPVLYGPHMTSFATECRELESVGAARMVQPGDWPDALARWLALGEAYLQGQAGRELLVRRPLVGPALAELIVQALGLRPTEAVAA
jgi:3-deoxy-D-manno-octulosonic-acid transferase